MLWRVAPHACCPRTLGAAVDIFLFSAVGGFSVRPLAVFGSAVGGLGRQLAVFGGRQLAVFGVRQLAVFGSAVGGFLGSAVGGLVRQLAGAVENF